MIQRLIMTASSDWVVLIAVGDNVFAGTPVSLSVTLSALTGRDVSQSCTDRQTDRQTTMTRDISQQRRNELLNVDWLSFTELTIENWCRQQHTVSDTNTHHNVLLRLVAKFCVLYIALDVCVLVFLLCAFSFSMGFFLIQINADDEYDILARLPACCTLLYSSASTNYLLRRRITGRRCRRLASLSAGSYDDTTWCRMTAANSRREKLKGCRRHDIFWLWGSWSVRRCSRRTDAS